MKKKKHSLHSWAHSPAYRSWTAKRDKALEVLLRRAQLESADLMRELLSHALLVCKSQYHQLKSGEVHGIEWFEHALKAKFQVAVHDFDRVMNDLKRRCYTLSKASEAEIAARLIKSKPVQASVTRADIERVKNKDSMAGGKQQHRIALYLDRLRRRITSIAQTSVLIAKDEEDFLRDVLSSFPRSRRVIVPRRTLHKIKEAKVRPDFSQSISDEPPASVAVDVVDDDEWQDMLDAYMNEYVPKWRDPKAIVDLANAPMTVDNENYYAWEYERDLTNEFVRNVRDGQSDAANEAGITDFVWIAVVDDKTDDCCLWRDGLLTSEIEEQLADHEDEDSECDVGDGINPPIHFNCRCNLAPATENIPDVPDDGLADFEDWLNS